MPSHSRRIRKKNSSDDTLYLNTIRDDDTWSYGYGGFPYDKCMYGSKNRRGDIIERLSYDDTNYWDDRSLYDSYNLKNVFHI